MTDYRKMYIRMLDEAERVLDVLESGRDNEQKVFLACAMLAAAFFGMDVLLYASPFLLIPEGVLIAASLIRK